MAYETKWYRRRTWNLHCSGMRFVSRRDIVGAIQSAFGTEIVCQVHVSEQSIEAVGAES